MLAEEELQSAQGPFLHWANTLKDNCSETFLHNIQMIKCIEQCKATLSMAELRRRGLHRNDGFCAINP